MARLGIEAISVFGLPPLEHVRLAADLGCSNISLGYTAFPYNPHGYPPFSLRDDPALRRDLRDALRDHGVTISLAEGFNVRPGVDVADHERDLTIFADLGAARINSVSMDPDIGRTRDQFAALAERAAAHGLPTTMEFAPGLAIADLPSALAMLDGVGRSDFTLLIDTMHLVRSGACAADVGGIDPARIGYIQLCDAPATPGFDSYFEESMFERVAPGEGGLGLDAIVAALPGDRTYSLELPLRTQAEAGIGPRERLLPCVNAARALLARAGHTIEPL